MYLSQLVDALHRTPIKLHTAADTIDTGSYDHHVTPREIQVVGASVVRQVEVVCACRPLGRDRVDLLDDWCDAVALA